MGTTRTATNFHAMKGITRGVSDEEDAKPKETTESGARAGGMQQEQLIIGAAPGIPLPGEGRISALTEVVTPLHFADAQEANPDERRPRELVGSVGRGWEREVRGGWACSDREIKYG